MAVASKRKEKPVETKTTTQVKKPVAKAPVKTTKRELSDETKQFISDVTINIIKDIIKPEQYDSTLCSIAVNMNNEAKEFDSAAINIFGVPSSITAFVPVLQVIVDLKEQRVAGTSNFVSPIVMRKDPNGNEVDAVLIGRTGDISIISANLVGEMMASVKDHDEEEPEPEAVEGEVE